MGSWKAKGGTAMWLVPLVALLALVGVGIVPMRPCPACNGIGKIVLLDWQSRSGPPMVFPWPPCEPCGGRGRCSWIGWARMRLGR